LSRLFDSITAGHYRFWSRCPLWPNPQKVVGASWRQCPISSAQSITQTHAQSLLDAQCLETQIPIGPAVASLIVQMDGSMIPIVETADSQENTEPIDRRKTRRVGWREARLGLSHSPEQPMPIFGATLGSTDDAGAQLLHSAIRTGLGLETYVHGVGDGAPWIATQVDTQIGGIPGRYLLDFYHLCDYLAEASQVCAPNDPETWMEAQKKRLKRNHFGAVLKTLKRAREPDSVPDQKAPVRAAYRYILNRPNQLDYKGTIASELPIGSGEIESAHRYIIQIRLKRSGSWWTVEKAEAMLALRVVRANQDWDDYWLNLPARIA